MDGRSKRIAKRRVALWAKNHSYGNETIPPPAAATPIPPPALPSGPNKPIADINCSDFSTHAAAQQWFRQHGGSPSNNVAGLDHDHDGLACESLP
jgi:Excalibur calcium-binding domain